MQEIGSIKEEVERERKMNSSNNIDINYMKKTFLILVLLL